MAKVPIGEAAEILGVTKEAIYNRIRRGTLKSSESNGVKYVFIGDEPKKNRQLKAKTKKQTKQTKSTEPAKINLDLSEFLLKEVDELKEQNQNLLKDKDRLFREKEQILVENKAEIAKIYEDRDEKLRYFLSMLERPLIARQNGEYVAPIDVEFAVDELPRKWVSLSEFLNGLNLDGKKLKKLQNDIIKKIGKAKFIKFKDGMIMVKSKKAAKKMIGERDA